MVTLSTSAAIALWRTASHPLIQEFARHFVVMQRYRHHADYAPATNFVRSRVMPLIEQTEQAINQFNSVPVRDRRAFAIYILFRLRPD